MSDFEKIFEELARHNDRSIIWNNWLDYVITINTVNPTKRNTNYYSNEESYIELMQAWLNELTHALETKPYYDILGHFYEELIQSKSKASNLGQAFTPQSVTDLISDIVINVDDNKTGVANDPTCGSSRTLLAAHVQSKGNIICIGQDLDLTSCQMSVLNFWSHGVRGSILHMDTLTQEVYQGWRVNKYLYHGLPVPHIEEIHSASEAYNFFELKNEQGNVPADVLVNPDDVESVEIDFNPDTGTHGKIIYKNGQTTLM